MNVSKRLATAVSIALLALLTLAPAFVEAGGKVFGGGKVF